MFDIFRGSALAAELRETQGKYIDSLTALSDTLRELRGMQLAHNEFLDIIQEYLDVANLPHTPDDIRLVIVSLAEDYIAITRKNRNES